MKKMLFIFIFTLCAVLAQAQTSIGLNLSSFLYKEMNIAIEHKISEHWSASASGGINLKVLKRHITDEEAEHDSNFPHNALPSERSYTHRTNAKIHYWTKKVYSGAFVSIGGEWRSDSGLDANIGLGYMFPIWNGLSGVVLYDTGIIRSSLSGKLSPDDFKIGICWIF